MDSFTVKIYFKNGKVKTLENVNALNYSTWLTNNKWGFSVHIGQNINNNPRYYTYKDHEFNKVLIINGSK